MEQFLFFIDRLSAAVGKATRLDRAAGRHASFAERQNSTMRMHMRRFTRLSKKVENHVHSLALLTTYYNLVKVHSKLRMSPAMAAGGAGRLWDFGDLVKLVEAAEPKAAKRGQYTKRLVEPAH